MAQESFEQHDVTIMKASFKLCALTPQALRAGFLKKPWRIATDHVRLAAALDGQLCRGDHSHAVTIGKAAKASEAYSPRLARCITDAFLEEL